MVVSFTSSETPLTIELVLLHAPRQYLTEMRNDWQASSSLKEALRAA